MILINGAFFQTSLICSFITDDLDLIISESHYNETYVSWPPAMELVSGYLQLMANSQRHWIFKNHIWCTVGGQLK